MSTPNQILPRFGGCPPWLPAECRRLRRVVLLALLAPLLLAGTAAFGAEATVSKEYQIKAAFLYNFTKFVNWPAQRFKAANSPIVIAVMGSNPFGDELENVVRNRQVNGRGLVVKIISDVSDATSVDLLFIPAGEEYRLGGHLTSINGAGVFTVGESEKFGALGGMIVFTLDGDKVRFAINRAAAELAGLRVSVQLLKLGTTIVRKPEVAL